MNNPGGVSYQIRYDPFFGVLQTDLLLDSSRKVLQSAQRVGAGFWRLKEVMNFSGVPDAENLQRAVQIPWLRSLSPEMTS